jgi:hypothetical protein
MLLLFLVATMLLAPWPVNVWLVALSACPSWYRDYRRGLLASNIGQPGVQIAESAQEILVPGDRAHALREYAWIARSQHFGDMPGETLIDITPARDGRSDADLRRIGGNKSRGSNGPG